ncbi:MAG: PspC domain-containing protein [Flavobacteriales bacterium]|nr:PspC domain-containing protein [Flavobacteriales bacterium]
MNKTVTANISGVVFHIETDAYEKLHQYLNTIRKYFRDSDGTDEIMADIEARIAELFKEKLEGGRDVITMENVQQVVEVMGEPEQYMDEDTSESYQEAASGFYQEERTREFKTKKLYRDPEDNVLGGVCSGLGYYFGIDRIWLRVAFLISFFGFAFGGFLYIILWIIIPAAKSTSEKLEMKGEPINVENIGNTIKEEFNTFKKKVDNGNGSHYVRKTENFFYKFFDFIGKILLFLLKFIGKAIGVFFIIGAIAGLITLVVFLIGGPPDFSISGDLSNLWTTDVAEIFFTSSTMFYLGLVGLILVATLPLLGILYGGAKILFDAPSMNKTISLSAISLLVVGVILIFVSATTTFADYSNQQRKSETIELTGFESDTIRLVSMESTYSSYNYGIDELFIENDEIFISEIEIDVIKSKSDQIELKLKKEAKGSNRKEAGRRAENIMVQYSIDGNELKVSPLISVPFNDRFRDQEVEMSIALPVGKTIYLDQSAGEIIYDIKNVDDMYDRDMLGHYWTMTDRGLECADCYELESKSIENMERAIEDEARRFQEKADEFKEKAKALEEEALRFEEKAKEFERAKDGEF